MSQILNLFLLSILLTNVTSFPSSTNIQRNGRCRGRAVNYLVSVPSLQGCVEACDHDERCCHYSHHKSVVSHPYHDHCLLFSAEDCDVTDLMYSDVLRSHWVSGSRTKASARCPHSTTTTPPLHLMLLRATR